MFSKLSGRVTVLIFVYVERWILRCLLCILRFDSKHAMSSDKGVNKASLNLTVIATLFLAKVEYYVGVDIESVLQPCCNLSVIQSVSSVIVARLLIETHKDG